MADASTSLMSDADTGVAEDHWTHDHGFGEGVVEQIKKFDGVEALGNGYAELAKLQGTMISPPKEGDTDEQRTEKLGKIYGQLGCPDKADGYKLDKPEQLPDGIAWSDEAAASIRETAHKAGLSQAQLDALVTWNMGQQTKALQAAQAAGADAKAVKVKQRAEAIDALKIDWGNSGYEIALQNSLKALKVFGGDEAVKVFQKAGIDNHPAVLKMFDKIYDGKLSEDTLVIGEGPTAEKVVGMLNYPSMEKK